MALIAVAADKGSPGVTTSSVALAAVWPRPVLLAECDPAGGDLVYRLPGASGGQLDVRRGLLSLAVAARRGLQPQQVWEHTQKLHGGLDVLTGVTSAEQGVGLEALWGQVGAVLSAHPQADVIADCGRVGADGPFYDLLAQAAAVVLITRPDLGDVVRLRDRVSAVSAALGRRGRPGVQVGVVVIAEHKVFGGAVAEIGRAIADGRRPGVVIGGIAFEPKSADQLRGEWGGKLDRSLLIRTARQIAAQLSAGLPAPKAPPGNAPTGNASPGNASPGNASPANAPPGSMAAAGAGAPGGPAGPPAPSAGPGPRVAPWPDQRPAPLIGAPSAESLSPLPSPDGGAPSARRRGRHAEAPQEDALDPDPRQNGLGEPEPVSPHQPPRGEW
jgi:hypothetical protein